MSPVKPRGGKRPTCPCLPRPLWGPVPWTGRLPSLLCPIYRVYGKSLPSMASVPMLWLVFLRSSSRPRFIPSLPCPFRRRGGQSTRRLKIYGRSFASRHRSSPRSRVLRLIVIRRIHPSAPSPSAPIPIHATLLYTSFVRCMRYLARIKDDAVNGRAPSALDDVAGLAPNLPFNGNASLKKFFHKARGIIDSKRRASVDTSSSESSIFSSSDDGIPNEVGQGRHDAAPATAAASPIGVVDDGSSVESAARANVPARKKQKKSKVRYGNSKLTKKLLGPSIVASLVGGFAAVAATMIVGIVMSVL